MMNAQAMNSTNAVAKQGLKQVDDIGTLVNTLRSKHLVVVDFFATWCGPCRMISPAFAKIAEKYGSRGDVAFLKVDVDQVPEANVRAMPTFRIYRDGKLVDEIEGAPRPAQLEAWIGSHLG